jgi:peptidoglycan/xylan/chitin deacetylase (PgdA/CDA1 family)
MLRNYKFQMLRSITKRLLIQSSLGAVNLLKLPQLMPGSGGRGMIFTLHHVRPNLTQAVSPNAHLSITPEFLDEAIQVAKDLGHVPVRLDDLPALLADPDDVRKFVCFTLDDGYRDNLVHAAPVFARHNAPYTVFVTPGFVDRERTIWWETAEKLIHENTSFAFDFGHGAELVTCLDTDSKLTAFDRITWYVETASEDIAVAQIDHAARACGIDPMTIVDKEIMTRDELRQLLEDPLASLGAHTMTHPNLARVCEERLGTEMRQSADAISRYIGRPVTTFSYPYGSKRAVSSREIKAAQDHGFAVAVTTQPGVLTRESLNRPTAFNRVPLNGYYQSANYVRALISGVPFRFA